MCQIILESPASYASSYDKLMRPTHVQRCFLTLLLTVSCNMVLQPLRDALCLSLSSQLSSTLVITSAVLAIPINSYMQTMMQKSNSAAAVRATSICILAVCVVSYIAFSITDRVEEDVQVPIACVFYVFVSMINVFSTSLVWTMATDSLAAEEAIASCGFICAGGTVGNFVGSAMTSILSQPLGCLNMLLIAALLALATLYTTPEVASHKRATLSVPPPPSSLLQSLYVLSRHPVLLTMCAASMLYSTTNSLFNLQRRDLARAQGMSADAYATHLGYVNTLVSVAVCAIQLCGTSAILKLIGPRKGLCFCVLVRLLGFVALLFFLMLPQRPGLSCGVWVVTALDAVSRVANYSISKPIREAMFASVPKEAKYASKGLIDIVAHRVGSSIAGALGHAETFVLASSEVGLGLSGLRFPVKCSAGVALSVLWLLVLLAGSMPKAHKPKQRTD